MHQANLNNKIEFYIEQICKRTQRKNNIEVKATNYI